MSTCSASNRNGVNTSSRHNAAHPAAAQRTRISCFGCCHDLKLQWVSLTRALQTSVLCKNYVEHLRLILWLHRLAEKVHLHLILGADATFLHTNVKSSKLLLYSNPTPAMSQSPCSRYDSESEWSIYYSAVSHCQCSAYIALAGNLRQAMQVPPKTLVERRLSRGAQLCEYQTLHSSRLSMTSL